MTERQIRIAAAILLNAARPDDLRELAESIIAECPHPNDKRVLVPNDDSNVAAGGVVACAICKSTLEKPGINLWRAWQRSSKTPVLPRLLFEMTPEQAVLFAAKFNAAREIPT